MSKKYAEREVITVAPREMPDPARQDDSVEETAGLLIRLLTQGDNRAYLEHVRAVIAARRTLGTEA